MNKYQYATTQPQTRAHTCHWPGCLKQVPPAMFMCKPHWFALPKLLRDKVWAAYEPGQEVSMTPSGDYLAAVKAVLAWIKENAR